MSFKTTTFILLALASTFTLPAYADDFGTTPSVGAPVDADWWRAKHESFLNVARTQHPDIVFFGDSITDYWRGDGADIWKKNFEPLHAVNFGIGGDRIEQVLWRLEHGELDTISPKLVVLLIGTNNLPFHDVDAIQLGHDVLIAKLREKAPQAKILLLAVFPRVDEGSISFRDKIAPVNQHLKALADGYHVVYQNIGPAFLDAQGALCKEISYDGLHLTRKGYEIWAGELLLPARNRLQ